MMKVAKIVFLLTLCMSDVATDRSSSARETCTEDDLLREEKVVSAEQESGQHVKHPGFDSTFASSGSERMASTMAGDYLASSLAASLGPLPGGTYVSGGAFPKTTLESSASRVSTLPPGVVVPSPFGETPSPLLGGTLGPASSLRALSSNRSGGVETFEAWLTRHDLDSVAYMMEKYDPWEEDPTFRVKDGLPFQPYDVRFVPDEMWNKHPPGHPQYIDPPPTSTGLNSYQLWRLFSRIDEEWTKWTQWKLDTELAKIRAGEHLIYPAKTVIDKRAAELIDICFVMDATQSMRPWIEATMATVQDEVARIARAYGKTPRIGIVAYRDVADTSTWLPEQRVSGKTLLPPESQTRYPRAYQFTRDRDRAMRDLKAQQAYGGSDIPEDVVGGLNEALHLDWLAQERILLLITDAPPHGYLAQAARMLKKVGGPEAEMSLKQIARYVDNFVEGDPSKMGMEKVLQRLKQSFININLVLVGDDVQTAKEWAKIMKLKYTKGTSDGQQMDLHSGEFQVMHYKEAVNMSNKSGFMSFSLEKSLNAMARTRQATDLGSTLGPGSEVSPEILMMREAAEADKLANERASDFDPRGSLSSGLAASGGGLQSTRPSSTPSTLEASWSPPPHRPMASTLAASVMRTPTASTASFEASGGALTHSLASSGGPPPRRASPMTMGGTLVGPHTVLASTIGD